MQPTIRRTREFDPNLFIPDGLDDAYHAEVEFPEEDTVEIEEGEELETPDSITVVRQIRRQRNGTMTVDLVIDVEDLAGIVKYDFRITKLDETGE